MKAFTTAAAALAATFVLALAATDTTPAEAAEDIANTAEDVAEQF